MAEDFGLEGLDHLSLLFLDSQRKWLDKARDKQVLPTDGWSLAIARSGRGWGKTEVGAQWVGREAGAYPGIVIHAVAPSHGDLIGTMFNGISGIMNVVPHELIESTNFSAAIPTITFKNGSLIRGFTAQSPERLRGPQASRVWGDEIAAWQNGAEATLTNIDMSTRIAYQTPDGRKVQPQRFYTTTPKPLQWLAQLLKRADIVIEGSTYENKANLAEDYIRDLSMYEGTQIGRQEIHGELLDIAEAAIIKKSWLKIWKNADPLPWFDYIIVGMDTAFTQQQFDTKTYDRDPTACQVWGVFSHNKRWNLMLLERWKDQLGMPDLIKAAKKELRRVYGHREKEFMTPLYGSNRAIVGQEKKPDILLIEEKGSGISLRQMLAAEGIDSHPYNPGKADKMARLHNVSHVSYHGRVWLPESTRTPGEIRNWAAEMLDEVCVYSGPGTTKHDDEVDVYSMVHRFFADRYMTAGVEGVMKPDSLLVDVQLDPADVPEWIEGQDRRPGDQPPEEELYNYYGD